MDDERKEALDEMHLAALELIKLIGIERRCPSGGPSWHAVEVALLNIRDAWEEAKACEIWPLLLEERKFLEQAPGATVDRFIVESDSDGESAESKDDCR
jgi:hypothetical protein